MDYLTLLENVRTDRGQRCVSQHYAGTIAVWTQYSFCVDKEEHEVSMLSERSVTHHAEHRQSVSSPRQSMGAASPSISELSWRGYDAKPQSRGPFGDPARAGAASEGASDRLGSCWPDGCAGGRTKL